jgi:tetratricopeptide (TPR) repeat protein
LRLAQQKVQDASDTGIGLDLGMAFQREIGDTGLHRWSVGANLQNLIEPKIKLDQEQVPDPRNLKLGLGYQGRPRWNRLSLALALDLDLPSEADPRLRTGAEVGLDDMFFLRAGADAGHLTLGFGLSVKGIQFDYAMRNDSDLSRNDRFTLGVRFGTPVDERRALRQRERQQAVNQELERLLEEREIRAYELARAHADDAYAAGDYEGARVLYRRVLAMDPNDSVAPSRIDDCDLRLALGSAREQLTAGETARAMASYQAVLQRWPGNGEATSQLAQLRRQIEMAENREQQLNDLFRESLAQFSEGEYVGALASLDELLRLDPEHELGQELRDRADRLRLEKGDEAMGRARSLAQQQRWPEAVRSLETVRQLLPERGPDLAVLADRWEADHRAHLTEQQAQRRAEEEARLAAATAAASGTPAIAEPAPDVPSPERQRALEAQFEKGLTAFQAGDFEVATRIWQAIWDEWPDFEGVDDYLVKAHLYEAIELYSAGQYRGALEHCRRVLEVDPGNQKAVRYLANIEEEQFTLQELGIKGD